MKIYVENLSPAILSKELRQLFSGYGKVESATIMTDQMTHANKSFGFVEMADEAAAREAIAALNGRVIAGTTLGVKRAHCIEKVVPSTILDSLN